MGILKNIKEKLRPKFQKTKLFLQQTYYEIKTKAKPFDIKYRQKLSKEFMTAMYIFGVVIYRFGAGISWTYSNIITPKIHGFFGEIKYRYNCLYVKILVFNKLRKEIKRIGGKKEAYFRLLSYV